MRTIFPKAPDDRGMTRQEWKKLDGYCRTVDKIVTPKAEAIVEQSMIDLVLYGYSEIRIPTE